MKQDVDRLKDAFRSGRLVPPDATVPTFTDLARALALGCGIEGPGTTQQAREWAHAWRLGKVLFVLVDGLGCALLERLPEACFLRQHVVGELRAVYPSTTAAALTTLATCEWPCWHAVPGWWMRLAARKLDAVVLPFTERRTETSLAEFGVSASEVFPLPAVWSRTECAIASIVPEHIASSVYSLYASGGSARLGYRDLGHALELARTAILNPYGPRFVYLYLPFLDTLCHRTGVAAAEVIDLLTTLDGALATLCAQVRRAGTVVISADHGQIDVPRHRVHVLAARDPLVRMLVCQPSGEPTLPIFHVRPGREDEFAQQFRARFGDVFVLLTPDEIEGMRLLGPEKLSATTRQRLGTFAAVGLEPATFYVKPLVGADPAHVGVHAGLSREEMVTPLIMV